VRRGWAAVIPARRGYGGSREPWAEGYGGCRSPDYYKAGLASARNIQGAIDYARTQPWADPARIVSVGHSAGAFGSVALSSLPIDGLAAVIAFAPGRGSQRPNVVCREDRLVEAFGRYGATSRVPVLLVYVENDLFFGPPLASRDELRLRAGQRPCHPHRDAALRARRPRPVQRARHPALDALCRRFPACAQTNGRRAIRDCTGTSFLLHAPARRDMIGA